MSLRAKMWFKKIRQKDIATKIHRNQSLISHVLSGRKTSAPVIRAIQEAVNGNGRRRTD
jgi:predicted transcriptional regulator